VGSFESEKFAVQLARGSLKFGNSGIAEPDSMAQIGIFLSQIGGAGFEGQEATALCRLILAAPWRPNHWLP
jgi:hypothetical protein